MSKLNEYAIELDEQAGEMGFESLQQALQAGCEVEYGKDTAELLEPLEAAHRAWKKEKEEVLEGLAMVIDCFPEGSDPYQKIERAYDFVEEAHE